jgi:hypothetical protein
MEDLRNLFSREKSNPGYCLVLRPFPEEFTRVWDKVGELLKRDFYWTDVKSLAGAGEIMPQVLSAIAQTDVVVVDISGGNPNVFYELGIARYAKGDKKVILVKQHDSPEYFDVSGTRYLEYEPSPEGIKKMVEELQVRIRAALEHTAWFLLAEGETHIQGPLPGQNGDYQFEVRAVSLSGGNPPPESVTLDLSVRVYPPSGGSSPDRSQVRLQNKQTSEIPNLPWCLKFEYFEFDNHRSRKARICVVPKIPGKRPRNLQ